MPGGIDEGDAGGQCSVAGAVLWEEGRSVFSFAEAWPIAHAAGTEARTINTGNVACFIRGHHVNGLTGPVFYVAT